MTAAAWVLVICVGLVVCSATATEPAQRTAQLFIATSDDRIVRLDEWRQQEITNCATNAHDVVAESGGGQVFFATPSNLFAINVSTQLGLCVSGLTGMISSGLPASPAVGRMDIDEVNGAIYFAEGSGNTVSKVDLAGGAATAVVSNVDANGPVRGVAVAPGRDMLIWSTYGNNNAGTFKRTVMSATLAGASITERWSYGNTQDYEILGLTVDRHDGILWFVEKRSATEYAVQRIDITAASWDPTRIESGIPTTAEIYIAADAVREFLWWSHQANDVVHGINFAASGNQRLDIDVGGSGYPQGLFFEPDFPALPCSSPAVTYGSEHSVQLPADPCPDGSGSGSDNGATGALRQSGALVLAVTAVAAASLAVLGHKLALV